jgi:hypothetical protein
VWKLPAALLAALLWAQAASANYQVWVRYPVPADPKQDVYEVVTTDFGGASGAMLSAKGYRLQGEMTYQTVEEAQAAVRKAKREAELGRVWPPYDPRR